MKFGGQSQAFAIVLIWTGISFGAHAEQISGEDLATGGSPVLITEMYAQERRSHGALRACEISYKAAFEDQTNRIGNYVGLVGSISLHAPQGKQQPLAFFFKTGVFDMGKDGNTVEPVDLSYLYLSTSKYNLSGKEFTSFDCGENEKFMCVAYDAYEIIEALEELSFRFEVNYTESGSSMDITVPINMRIYDKEAVDKYNGCVLGLIDEVQDSLQ